MAWPTWIIDIDLSNDKRVTWKKQYNKNWRNIPAWTKFHIIHTIKMFYCLCSSSMLHAVPFKTWTWGNTWCTALYIVFTVPGALPLARGAWRMMSEDRRWKLEMWTMFIVSVWHPLISLTVEDINILVKIMFHDFFKNHNAINLHLVKDVQRQAVPDVYSTIRRCGLSNWLIWSNAVQCFYLCKGDFKL